MLIVRRLLATSVVVAVSAGVAAAAIDRPPTLSAQPEGYSHGKSPYDFTNVREMAATADVVVVARVTNVNPGRTTGVDTGRPTRMRAVTLNVEKVLASSVDSDVPPRLVMEEQGWDVNTGVGYVADGVQWSQSGDTGTFFLSRNDDNDDYQLVNPQGRILDRTGRLEASGGSDALPLSDAPTAAAVSDEVRAGHANRAALTKARPSSK